jgi:hypothetical protein
MRYLGVCIVCVCLVFSVFAAIPETLYKGGAAVYENADLNSIAEYFRSTEKVNVLFKDKTLGEKTVTLNLTNMPKYVILQYAARCAGVHCAYKGYGAIIEKKSHPYQIRKPASSFAAVLKKKIAFDMNDPSLEEVVQMLTQVHGVNIVFVNPEKWSDKTISSLSLKKVTIMQLLNYMSELYGIPVTLDKYAVFIGEKKQVAKKKPAPAKVKKR